MTTIRLASEFSPYLGGRYKKDGPFSGEAFRDDVLTPKVEAALKAHDQVRVIFDGVAGAPSSFLEEAFGGLLRRLRDRAAAARAALKLEATDPELLPYVALAERFMSHELSRQGE